MRDVYKYAVDTVKAPDALVQKTLDSMFEEHSKIKMKTSANAGYKKTNERQAPQKGSRWIAHALLPTAACLFLYLIVIAPRLSSPDLDVHNAPNDFLSSPGLETQAPSVIKGNGFTETDIPAVSASHLESPQLETLMPVRNEISESIIEALAIDNLSTRSGPSTKYRETGSYQVKGETVRLLSLIYDDSDVCWVQCEVFYGEKLRRVYTGAKRFDTTTFDLGTVPEEAPLYDQVKVLTTSKAMYGPGDNYDTYAGLTVDEGQTLAVIAIENDYAQVEWMTSTQSYRAWVSVHTLDFF